MKTLAILLLTATMAMACTWNEFCSCDAGKEDININVNTSYSPKCAWGHSAYVVSTEPSGNVVVITYRCWKFHTFTVVH